VGHVWAISECFDLSPVLSYTAIHSLSFPLSADSSPFPQFLALTRTSYLILARLVVNKTPPDYHFALTAATQALDVFTTCLGADSEKAVEARQSVRAFSKQVKGIKK
jgi:hypothetical protein